ncbi:MAG: hypothetical protein PHS32_08105 [Rhodoferax sp.]|uniref:hypothetical protein n=1 Tax=Rhodoferax sp. TaxID=50421 RepID=UPI0026184AED|nr:hypothetical protein [Rhodoferax sp.]MDD5333694.1 hypothetical protein [Rhodoferax sp.]
MKQKMKLVAAIVAGIGAISAQAGQLAGNPSTIYAAEAVTNIANVPVPTFTYQTSEPINGPVAGTNTIYVVFKATQGTWRAATATAGGAPAGIGPAAPTVKLLAAASGSNAAAVALNGALVVAPVVINGVTYTSSAGVGAGANNTLVYSFTIPTNAIYGLGSNIYFGSLDAGDVALSDRIGFLTGLSAALGTGAFDDCATFTGGEVKVKATLGNSTGAQIDTIAPNDPEKVLLKSALGIAVDVTASADTAKIDAIANVSKTFTRTAAGGTVEFANLGTVKMTNAVPATTNLTGGAYNVAAIQIAANTLEVTVNGDFTGQTAAGLLSLNSAATCAVGTTIAGGTTTLNLAKTVATLTYPMNTAGLPGTGVASYVCYTPIGTVALNPAAFTASVKLIDATPAAFNYGKLAVGASCPAVTFTSSLNASRVIVRNYSPAAANAYGWNQYTRVINSGSQDAGVTGFYLYGDGSMGTEKSIAALVKKAGSVTLSNTAIEALLGAPVQPAGVTTNPRLVIQAPTSSLRVQNYIVQPNGAWFEASAGQNEIGSGAVTFTGTQE